MVLAQLTLHLVENSPQSHIINKKQIPDGVNA